MTEHFDVVIIGAGLSGVDAAYHLQTLCRNKSYAILESRDAIGGTWDLFRYPGIRSDSDMYTFGYSFRPWLLNAAIADGESIRAYIRETAAEHGIDRHIRFHHRVMRASWSSTEALWTLEVERRGNERARFTCNFVFGCTGYYDYASGYTPDFPSMQKFCGRLVHPQQWPQDLDYAGKRVVVIGSGATAVTIIPVMAENAAHVTMLQRSPSYILSLPAKDSSAVWLRRFLPVRLAFSMARWRNMLRAFLFYRLCRSKPEAGKKWIIQQVREQLGADYDVETHFTPRYNPWEQRLCIAPDADFFRAIKTGKANVVTDEIEAFTETGIRLRSGAELQADIIVTATGLRLLLLGGMEVLVDGGPVNFAETMNFKGAMLTGIPNLAVVFGYTNVSWTLKADLIASYVCRLINYMDERAYASCTPRLRDPSIFPKHFIDFSSGYVRRGVDQFPRQGSKRPWKLNQNYMRDFLALRLGPVDDKALEFVPRRRREAKAA